MRAIVQVVLVLVLVLSGIPGAARADGTMARSFESGTARARVIELFTSEGCSSCPPADAWLSGLTQDPRLWKELVPIGFHVSYWDWLGWRDRFASEAHTRRQYRYAERNSTSAYTPGFVVNGDEWRGWFRGRSVPANGREEAGVLRVKLQGDTAEATFVPAREVDEPLELHVVLLGFDLASDVRAGENSGRTLRHDFVVLEHAVAATTRDEGGFRGRVALADPAPRPSATRALAAWVSAGSDPAPLQAVGGWLQPPVVQTR